MGGGSTRKASAGLGGKEGEGHGHQGEEEELEGALEEEGL